MRSRSSSSRLRKCSNWGFVNAMVQLRREPTSAIPHRSRHSLYDDRVIDTLPPLFTQPEQCEHHAVAGSQSLSREVGDVDADTGCLRGRVCDVLPAVAAPM